MVIGERDFYSATSGYWFFSTPDKAQALKFENSQVEKYRNPLDGERESVSHKPRFISWGHHGSDLMVVGFTTTYDIGTYHH